MEHATCNMRHAACDMQVTAWLGRKVTFSSAQFGSSPSGDGLKVVVGGVHINEPPVLRTVLYNGTTDQLWEVHAHSCARVRTRMHA